MQKMPVGTELAKSSLEPTIAQAMVLGVKNQDKGECGEEHGCESRKKSRRWKCDDQI